MTPEEFTEDWIKHMGRGFPLSVGSVAEYLNRREQADARPAGHFFKASRVHPWVQVEKECPNAVPLYTHPEASAPGLSDEDRRALEESAKEMLKQGFKWHGSALLEILTRASAATVAEPSGGTPDTYPARLLHESDKSLAWRVDSWHERRAKAAQQQQEEGGK